MASTFTHRTYLRGSGYVVGMSGHDEIVREQFARQASTFVTAAHANAPEPLERFLALIGPTGAERTLDVACGPGLVARALAPRVATFVGIDLTRAMIDKAEEVAAHLPNATFRVANAERLPFDDASFDLVVTRLALHHMADPARAVAEMARVVRRGGKLAVFDIQGSEDPDEAREQTAIETLRDPSHARALPLSELVATMERAHLEIQRGDAMRFEIEVDDWIARATQAPENAAEARARLLAAVGTRRFGGNPVYQGPRGLCFLTRYAMVLGERV